MNNNHKTLTEKELKQVALIEVGNTCFGPSWQTEMTKRLNQCHKVSQRTLRYWVKGDYEIPNSIMIEVLAIAKKRIAEIEASSAKLQELINNMVPAIFQDIYGVINDQGNVELFYKSDGERVITIPNAANLYPIRSKLSAEYKHDHGIVITRSDAKKYNLEIE